MTRNKLAGTPLRRRGGVFAGNLWVMNLGAALFWLLLWALAASGIGQSLLLPGPGPVIRTLIELAGKGSFWQAVAASVLRTFEALAWGVFLGAILAVCTAAVPLLHALLRPALLVVRAMPVASFIILALVWLRGDRVPVLAGAIMVLPIVWGNVSQGIEGVNPGLIEMTRMYDFSRWRRTTRLYMPSVLPTFLAACETSMGLCWKATIAAEVLGLPRRAIGSQLHNAKIYLESEALFAWTLTVILLSLTLERVLARGVRALTRHMGIDGGRADHAVRT